MADDSAQESPLYSLLTLLDDAPNVIRPGHQRSGVIDWHSDVLAVVGPWVDDLLAAATACGAMAKSPSPGQGIDSVWLRLLRAYLKGFVKVRNSEGLTEALGRYTDDLGLQAAEFRSVAYYAAKFRSTHTPGDLSDLDDDDEPDLFAQIRGAASRYEKRWIDSKLPPRDGTLTLHKVTPFTSAQDELERAIYRFEEEVGGLVLRLTDDCLVPERLRRTPFFAHAVFDALKGGGCYPGSLFRRLCFEWLPGEVEGYGGEDWLYPGCREDDAKRFNAGIRVARCAAALADALQGVVIEERPKSEPPPAGDPLTTVFLWGDVLPAKNLNVEAFYSPHAELARDIHSAGDNLEREAEKGPTPTRKVESEDGSSASYPHREGNDPFPDTKESIAKCRAAIDVCPESIRAELRNALNEASSFASTRSKATLADMMADIRRLAVRLRGIAHRVFDEGQAATTSKPRSGSESPHVSSLEQLAAEMAAERERDEAAGARSKDRFSDYYGPYDAIWLDLVHAKCNPAAGQPLNPSWLLDILTKLVERARMMDAFDGGTLAIDRLHWLPTSPPAVAHPIAKAFALALAAAADGSLDLEGAKTVCGMLEAHPGSELNTLYRAYPEGDNSPRFEPMRRPSNDNPQANRKAPDPIVGFSAHELVAQFGGSLGESDWEKGGTFPPPSNYENPSLLLTSLRRLRDRFAYGAKHQLPLVGVMVHTTEPKQGPQPDWPDAFVEGLTQLAIRPGLSSKSKQLHTQEDYAAVANRPFLNWDGTPITTSAGEPIPMRPEWHRLAALYGKGDYQEGHSASVDEYESIADEAGRLVRGLPASVQNVLWQDWTTTVLMPTNDGVWLTALFELAWQRHEHSGLEADRWAWIGRRASPIDSLGNVLSGEMKSPRMVEIADAAGFPAAYWYSRIENVWQASEAAVDLLTSMLATAAEEVPPVPVEPPPQTDSSPEPSKLEKLEKATPPLIRDNGLWVSNKRAAELEGLGTRTLSDYRLSGIKTADEMLGRDKDGRIWRRVGTKGAHPWYLRSTLKCERKP